jgi:transposase-like protein
VDEAAAIDTLERRSGSRRYRGVEEKRRIVEESLVPGVSVAMIARKYEVNANQVFGWRRLYQQGLLEVRDAGEALAMMPVKVAEDEAPARHDRRKKSVTPPARGEKDGSIEIV